MNMKKGQYWDFIFIGGNCFHNEVLQRRPGSTVGLELDAAVVVVVFFDGSNHGVVQLEQNLVAPNELYLQQTLGKLTLEGCR